MGPPSSGGSTVGEALNILEGYNLAAMPRDQALHYYLEASRYAYADRNAYLADPATSTCPLNGPALEGLRGDAARADQATAATSPVAPGDPYPYSDGSRGCDGDCSRDDDAPRDVRQAATSSRTRSRSSRPAAPGSSSPASGSCSTTS